MIFHPFRECKDTIFFSYLQIFVYFLLFVCKSQYFFVSLRLQCNQISSAYMDTSANLDLLPGNFSDDTVREIVAAQRRFFRTGTTLPVSWRIRQLKRLKEAVLAHEAEFIQALAVSRAFLPRYLRCPTACRWSSARLTSLSCLRLASWLQLWRAVTPLSSSPVLNPQPAQLLSSGSLQKSFLLSMSH